MADSSQTSGKGIDTKLVKRLLTYVKPYRKFFFLALTLTITLAILSPLRPYLIAFILDNPVANGDIGQLRFWVSLILGLLVIEAFIMYGNTFLTNWLGQSIIKDIRNQVFQHILRLRLQFFDRTPIGTLQTRTISDVETLNDVFTSGLVRILGDLLQLVAIFVMMLITSWQMTLVVLITIPLLLYATYVFKNKVKASFQRVRSAVSEMNAFMQEHITGMQIVHIFHREEEELSRFDKINRKLRKANLNSVLYYSVFFPAVEIISALGLAILVWYGANAVVSVDNDITFGVLVAFIMYIQMFFRPLRMLADQFNTLQLGMVSGERIFKILDTDEFIPNKGQKSSLNGLHGPENIHIRFKDVSFAYKEPEWVLQNVDFEVNPGEKIALVGATGSGKTTIINLLSRFYDIQRGEILLNGEDIRTYSLDYLRGLTGVVLQDVFLFSGSIYDNITLNNPDVPLEKVIESAKQVGAHDFIQNLPGQYNYNVRERGATLSLGQRQLIAFARVMTYNPSILVLDEATANIDTESEEIIQQAIDTVMAGRTSLIIAHRLSTIQKADKIIVLRKGKIIEKGSHQELLNQEGAYFDLHQKQFAVS
ncbi:MAG: ABC transporter ATP-binding protein [Bacteroidota bacterium]